MEGKAFGPVKAQCPSIEKCQGQELGVGGLMSRGRGGGEKGIERFSEEKPGKGITFEM